jgi:hypothetical protein
MQAQFPALLTALEPSHCVSQSDKKAAVQVREPCSSVQVASCEDVAQDWQAAPLA